MTRMPNPGRGPGGLDLNAMMKQVQQMQSEMMQAQEKLKDEIVEASAGGGMVKVKMSGDLRLLGIAIDPEAIDPEDAELLQDMVMAAVNEAIRSAQELATSKLGGIAGGGGGPGGLGLPGGCERAAPVDTLNPGAPLANPATDHRALPPARDRAADSAAARLPHPALPTSLRRSALAEAIREVKEKVGLCEVCFNLAEGPRCRICEDETPRTSLICVVEEPSDVIPIERTGEYRGLYHVLGGALSPIDGVDPGDLRIAELVRRTDGGEVSGVVLATNPTDHRRGDSAHIAELLRDPATITRLASGLPVGADLEHADEVTLGRALAGRRALDA